MRVNCVLLATLTLHFLSLTAEDPKPATGQASIRLKNGTREFKFDRVVAYESKDGSIAVLFGEKDLPVDKLKAALEKSQGEDDYFSYFGSRLKLTFSKTGQLQFLNANVDHTALTIGGSDALKGEFALKDRRVVGKGTLNSDGDVSDARFDVPLMEYAIAPPKPKAAEPETPKSPDSPRPPKAKKDTGDVAGDTPRKAPAAPAPSSGPNVYTLPIPKDAANLKYQKLTGQINFSSPSDIRTLADFYVKGLEPLGWTRTAKDLISDKSGNLKRAHGEATLSVFVRPADKGSTVQIISKGLNWDEQKPANEPTAK